MRSRLLRAKHLLKLDGLNRFRLTTSISRLGNRRTRFHLSLSSVPVRVLARWPPKRRLSELKRRSELQRDQIEEILGKRLRSDAPDGIPISLEGSATLGQVMMLLRHPSVGRISLRSIEGVRRTRETALAWFCVLGVVEVRIEGGQRKDRRLEYRWVVVQARDVAGANRKLQSNWREHATPYLNRNGRIVEWKLLRILEVQRLNSPLDPGGTEVFSLLGRPKTVKLQPYEAETCANERSRTANRRDDGALG
jgi:hypothetical protein